MIVSRRAVLAICAAGVATATALAGAVPVQAARATQAARTPGWRIVFSHHYPRRRNALSDYAAIVAPRKADAWAFGGSGSDRATQIGPAAAHWNGRRWRPARLPTSLSGPLIAASAPSPRNVWAVSTRGYALHWNGSRWLVVRRLGRGGSGVTAISPANVWVFTDRAFGGTGAMHYNDHRWTKVTGVGRTVVTASAVSAHDIWAIGYTRILNDSIDHYNGRTWTRIAAPPMMFTSILALSPTSVWAAGLAERSGHQVAVLLHRRGSRWHAVSLRSDLYILSIAPDGHGGIWLAGLSLSSTTREWGWVLHRSGKGVWTRTRLPARRAQVSVIFSMALIPGTTSLWGAGETMTKTGSDATIWAHGRT